MAYKIRQSGKDWLVFDEFTKDIRGRFNRKAKAVTRKNILNKNKGLTGK